MFKKMLKGCLVFGVLLLSMTSISQAQERFDDFKSDLRKDFDKFASDLRKDFDEFSEKSVKNKKISFPVYPMETTLLKIPAVSQKTGETFFFSAKAVNIFTQTDSLESFIKVSVSDGDVYVLPEEKISYPVWYEAEKTRLENEMHRAKRNVMGEANEVLCPPNTPECEDLLILWAGMGVQKQKIPNLVLGAQQNGFAETLKKDKRLCLGLFDGVVKRVERRQVKRLLGATFDVNALEEFMWQGGFTAAGWLDTFKEFCQQGRGGKLSEEQIRQVKSFAKRTEKAWKKKELPVIRLSNKEPWYVLESGTFTYALDCTKDL